MIRFVLILSLLICATIAVAQSTQPVSTQVADVPTVAILIRQLNDPDPQLREQATKALWSRGRAIEPALRAAAQNGPPEVARRARSILRDFTYGLFPDTPKEIFEHLEQYRTGDAVQKQNAIMMLNSRGIPGLRVLLKLRDEERSPNVKQVLAQVLQTRAHDVAILLLAEGNTAGVEQVLEDAATNAPINSWVPAQDYAAFLATTGKLADKLQKLKNEPLTVRSAALHLALARAAGDLASARAAAQMVADPEFLDAVLIEQGDWPALAHRMESNPQRLQPSERLGYLCAYYSLAGDEQNFQATARKLVEQADQAPQDHPFCAENLFLNGMPDQAESVLLTHHDYLRASSYLASRLEFKKALELPALAQKDQPDRVLQIQARTVEALHFIGEMDKAKQLLTEAAAENRLRNDLPTWLSLIEAARQTGQPALADEYAAEALAKATDHDPLAGLFEKLRLGDGVEASQWWRFLRHQKMDEPAAQTLRRLREIFDGSIKGDDLTKLADAAFAFISELQPVDRESWQQTVADTLAKSGRLDLAEQWYSRLAKASSNPHILIAAGDFEAARQNWPAAQADYASAWEHDPFNASALFLRGWALTQSGRAEEGRPMMENADRLPLGNESARHELLETMKRHNLAADAEREVNLILTITGPRSWEHNEALRQAAEQAAAKSDYLTAAGLWERAFLWNLSNNVSFVEPWANIVVPALVHKTRALGLIQSRQIEPAMKESRLTLQLVPADADALIELVNALDKSGQKGEADSLYQEHTMLYRQLITDYPTSGPAHNQLAWAQVMCHRELDDALKNAKRAVELEPASTASLDTLAEVYFARGDVQQAIVLMKRCVELEPRVQRHRQQLARFEKAPPAATQPTN